MKKRSATKRQNAKLGKNAGKTKTSGTPGVSTLHEPSFQTREVMKTIDMAKDPDLFIKRIKSVQELGVAGETKVIGTYLSVIDARLLPVSNSLGVANFGASGAGKSFALENCLKLYPEHCYYKVTTASPKSFFYLPDDFRHKAIVFAEGQNLQKDSDLVYFLRSLLSEGIAVHQATKGGQLTAKIVKEGPISLLTTTVQDRIEEQLMERLLKVNSDISSAQTRRIVLQAGRSAQGMNCQQNGFITKVWRGFHGFLKPVDVVIPFAGKLANMLILQGSEAMDVSIRRAFKHAMSLTKAISCAHQFARDHDSHGRVIADYVDWHLARQLILDSYMLSTRGLSQDDESRLAFLRKNGPLQIKGLIDQFGISRQAVSKWLKKLEVACMVSWCDRKGDELYGRALDKSKSSGKTFLKVCSAYQRSNDDGLPNTYQLSNDPAWDKGGELYERYSLDYDPEDGSSSLSNAGNQPVDSLVDTSRCPQLADISWDKSGDVERGNWSLDLDNAVKIR